MEVRLIVTRLMLCAILASLDSSACQAAEAAGRSTLIVALDRDAYRLRELHLLRGLVSDAANSDSNHITVSGKDGGVDVVVWDLKNDGKIVEAVTDWGKQKGILIETAPAESFSIDYAPGVVKAFGAERLARDASSLESYIERLRPPLKGVTITQDEHGAVIESNDPSVIKVIAGGMGISTFVVTPLTSTSWHVSWNTSIWSNIWMPVKRLFAQAETADALRTMLGDPLELVVYNNGRGVRFTVRDPAQHRPFIDAVNAAFAGNPDFIFRETLALDMRLGPAGSVRAASTHHPESGAAGSSDANPDLLPSEAYMLTESELAALVDPPADIRIEGNAVVVEAMDRARNGELSAIVRKALASRADLVLSALPDGSLHAELAPGTHLGTGVPTLSPDQLVGIVRTRLNAAGIKPRHLEPLDAGHVRIDFASRADAGAFSASLARPAGLTIRLVDEAAPDAPSQGDEKLNLPGGGDIWVNPAAIITGDMIVDASVGKSRPTEEPVIDIRLTDEGRDLFAAATRENIGRRFAIVLNGTVLEAPIIRDAIMNGAAEISGGFTDASAKTIVEAILAHRHDVSLVAVAAHK